MDVNINPTYPLFPVFSFASLILVLIPLPWHIQAWNVGTCAYIFWASVSCLMEFINSMVWRNNTKNVVPVWCDISSKFLLGASVGIPAAGLCISRRLYVISTIKSTIVTQQDKCRAVLLDSCIAFGLPIIVMALHYIVQGHRFDILEDIGCYPAIYNTLLSYFLVFMWPTLLGCVSFVFSAFTLRAFYKRRLEFSRLLSTHSSLSMSCYVRLMMLAMSEMMCTIPISIVSTYIANENIPAAEWLNDPSYRLSVEMTRWLFPASALLFFLLFGVGADARKHYRVASLRIAKLFGYRPASEVPVHVARKVKSGFNNISVGSLPVYIASSSSHPEHADPLADPKATRLDIDVEKVAGRSSPSLSTCALQDFQEPSPVATSSGTDIEESQDAGTGLVALPSPASGYRHTIPAYHRPFSLPSIYPTPHHAMQEVSRPLDNVYITVQTQFGPAV